MKRRWVRIALVVLAVIGVLVLLQTVVFRPKAIEVETVRVAAERFGPAELAVLDALVAEQAAAVAAEDRERFHGLDDAFHRRICELAGVDFAWTVVRENKAHMDRVRFLSLSFGAQAALDDHVAILDAVRAHDAPAAVGAMREHLGRITEILGRPGDLGLDVLLILKYYGLPTRFPADVEHESESLPAKIPDEEIARRTDFRKAPIVTIDPSDATQVTAGGFRWKIDPANHTAKCVETASAPELPDSTTDEFRDSHGLLLWSPKMLTDDRISRSGWRVVQLENGQIVAAQRGAGVHLFALPNLEKSLLLATGEVEIRGN